MVPVHRCVLAARSPFFGAAFAGSESGARLELAEVFGVSSFLSVLPFFFLGKRKKIERSTPVRKPHTSTSDLLRWSETPPPHNSTGSASSGSNARSHQPSDGISKVVFGGQVTAEESENLNKRKPCSGYKLKEITGSGIFAANGEDDLLEPGSANPASDNKTGLKMYQS